jgi:hypothetical protein
MVPYFTNHPVHHLQKHAFYLSPFSKAIFSAKQPQSSNFFFFCSLFVVDLKQKKKNNQSPEDATVIFPLQRR